uniref:N-acetyltransferase domain-containing protein n=1 Tax=Caenorhabditis tropicalis TaxID=1561998 RepID=A0A1I7T7I6_9PELO
MWPSESDLEPLDSIIDRMNPMNGYPYPMKSAINKGFPRGVGDPWIGAYTKNGYWFKLSWGGDEEWKEMSNEMWYRNGFLVDSKSYDLYKKVIEGGSEKLKLLVAKNIRGEVLGLALLTINKSLIFSMIGPIFVQEDFRHVGIGTVLMNEIRKIEPSIAMNSISYLLPTSKKFHLEPKAMRSFGRVRVKDSSGFANLKEEKKGVSFHFGPKISEDQWEKIEEFGEKCTNEKRNWKAYSEDDEDSQVVAAFDDETALDYQSFVKFIMMMVMFLIYSWHLFMPFHLQ